MKGSRRTSGSKAARRTLVGYVLIAILIGDRQLPPICPFLRLTGRRCPLCGTSRAIALATRGHIAESRAMHPLGLALLAFAICEIAASSSMRR